MEGLGNDGAGEDGVPTPPPDHVVPVPAALGRLTGGCRRAMQHVESGGGPARHELIGVHFGAAPIRVVEVAPRQCVDPPDTPLMQPVGDLTKFAKLITRHGRDDRPNTEGPCGYHRGACWT